MNNTLRLTIELVLSAILITSVFAAIEPATQTLPDWHPILTILPGLSLCSVLVVLYRHHRRLSAREQDITVKALALASLAGVTLGLISVSRAAISPYPDVSMAQLIFVMAMTFAGTASWMHWRKPGLSNKA